MFAQLADEIQQTITSNGGSMPYPELLETVEPLQRRNLSKALEYGKAMGTIKQVVAWDAQTSTLSHTVELVGA